MKLRNEGHTFRFCLLFFRSLLICFKCTFWRIWVLTDATVRSAVVLIVIFTVVFHFETEGFNNVTNQGGTQCFDQFMCSNHLGGRWKGIPYYSCNHPIHTESLQLYRTQYLYCYLVQFFARIWKSFGSCQTKSMVPDIDQSRQHFWLLSQSRLHHSVCCSQSQVSLCSVFGSMPEQNPMISFLRWTHRFSYFVL